MAISRVQMTQKRQLRNIWGVNPRSPPNYVKNARILQQARQKSPLKQNTSQPCQRRKSVPNKGGSRHCSCKRVYTPKHDSSDRE